MKLSFHAIRYTSIENPTLAHFRHYRHFRHSSLSRYPDNRYSIQSTNYYVRNYQRIMQNKPNFQDVQMNVILYNTKDYNNETAFRRGKNKPNSNPIKPNSRKAQMNVKLTLTKDYRKNDDFAVQQNKPNSNPIQTQSKPILSAVGGFFPYPNLPDCLS